MGLTLVMPPLFVAVMMAALSVEVYANSSWRSTPYSQDHVLLELLRGLSRAPAKTSVNVRSVAGGFPLSGWWITDMVHPKMAKKRQDVSSYNLNSFGLRYGK